MNEAMQRLLTDGICEIRWHGRGGQGAVSSGKILASAAWHAGFKGVTSAPSFGAERRGAPVTASTRICEEPIRVFSMPEQPAIVIVLDDTLMGTANATGGLKPGGWVIINSHRKPEDFNIDPVFNVAAADASSSAVEAGLAVSGVTMVNTPMLGAFAKATGLVSLDDIRKAIQESFPQKAAEINFTAARLTAEKTQVQPAKQTAAAAV
jgi:pyruvate ferredoxin oxidoreductase gamma subunit